MFKAFRDNKLVLTRGDSAIFNVKIKGYELTPEDEVVFTLKQNITDEIPLIQKTAELGTFILYPEETKDLQCGNYIYDVEITTPEGMVYTPIQSVFTIMRGVTE